MWQSARATRVVRSTLFVEAYARSEALERGQWVRHVLTELFSRPGTPLARIGAASTSRPLVVATDSNNLSISIGRGAGVVADKGLRIVISMLRQSVNASENTEVKWVRTAATRDFQDGGVRQSVGIEETRLAQPPSRCVAQGLRSPEGTARPEGLQVALSAWFRAACGAAIGAVARLHPLVLELFVHFSDFAARVCVCVCVSLALRAQGGCRRPTMA